MSQEEEEINLDTGERRILREEEPPEEPPKKPTIDGRTLLRLGLTPYLPPPVVKAIGQIDPLLEPYVGPEASITIASTLLLGFLVLQFLKVLSSFSRGGMAIAQDEDDIAAAQLSADDYGDSVILCGPMWAGKTRIFYHLCQGDAHVSTVMSLRVNAELLPTKAKSLRVLDYPGHSGLQDSLFVELLQSSSSQSRIVLVVDSTQTLGNAADCLYDLLQQAKDMSTQFDVFVACHKTDLSSSKNPRRIKIMLRTELEKLIKVRSTQASASEETAARNHWWKEGEPLDLDNLQYATLRFEATTCNVGDGIDKLSGFCKMGAME